MAGHPTSISFKHDPNPSHPNDIVDFVHFQFLANPPYKEDDVKEEAVAAYLFSGKNACPPEEVGGVDGYADALQPFNNPEDDEYDSMRHRMGEDFDPHFFDLRGIRRRVDDFQRTIGEARWGLYRNKTH